MIGRSRATAALRRVRPFVPVALRVAVFGMLVMAAGAPAIWAPGLGATPALSAYAPGPAAPQDASVVLLQGGDPATPTATPPDGAAVPIDTATPTSTLPPPPPPPPPPSPAASPSPLAASPTPYFGDPCWGDEQIAFSPLDPRANNEMLITVTSSRPHPYGRISGTEKATFVRERPGQLGTVWEWTVALTWPGKHKYTFFVDSTIPCKSAEVTVRRAPATATPTKTPEPGNENGD